MNRFSRVLLAAVVSCSSLHCIAQQPATSAKTAPATSTSTAGMPTEATVNEFLKKMFGWNQQLTYKVAEIKRAEDPNLSEVTIIFNTPQGQQIARLFITPDQHFALSGDLVPFGTDPFADAREKLKALTGPSRGPQDAPVTIVEFGDLECPACKAAQPNINKLMEEEPKVRLVFQNFPLEQVHKWAMLAAKYTDCIGRSNNDAVWKFISTVYEHQGEITDATAEQALKGYAKDTGADPAATAACVAKPETEKRVRDSLALGDKVGVTSTPTFFINGRKVAGFGSSTPYDMVKQMVDYDMNSTSTSSTSK
jgi:protein-disulfide isomerase